MQFRDGASAERPFQITITDDEPNVAYAESFKLPNQGPYPYDKPKLNSIRFTPVQVQAIRSSLAEGLTCIVGPPGSGKTDVAVQIVNLLYHNFPNQRTLLITHSNQALNQLFEKIMSLGTCTLTTTATSSRSCSVQHRTKTIDID